MNFGSINSMSEIKIKSLTEEEKNKWPTNVIVPLDLEFEDDRGKIVPLVDLPMESCVIIDSKKGTVRANHYHKTDWHFCYVVEGKIKYYHRPHGDVGKGENVIINKGELFFTPPMVDHSMVFLEDTIFLTLGRNSRSQEVYEKDVERIDYIDPDSVTV